MNYSLFTALPVFLVRFMNIDMMFCSNCLVPKIIYNIQVTRISTFSCEVLRSFRFLHSSVGHELLSVSTCLIPQTTTGTHSLNILEDMREIILKLRNAADTKELKTIALQFLLYLTIGTETSSQLSIETPVALSEATRIAV